VISAAEAEPRRGHYDFSPRKPNRLRDLTNEWERYAPLADLPAAALARVEAFCESKRITVEALEQLGTRARVNRHGGVVLAYPRYAGVDDGSIVCGIRLRDLDPAIGKSSVPGSRFAPPALPAVVGNVDSLDWLAVEGETDAARLWLLTRGEAAIVVYGGTQAARYAEWDALYPPDATVYVAFDADRRRPDERPSVMRGAEAAALLMERLPHSRRIVPLGAKDWAEWEGLP
jgi:hypothetical protein